MKLAAIGLRRGSEVPDPQLSAFDPGCHPLPDIAGRRRLPHDDAG
jgi:hypothetical protein